MSEENVNNETSGNDVSLHRLVGYWDRITCDLNCFKWRLLPEFLKPKGWDDMHPKKQYENKLHRFAYKVSCMFTTKRSRSRAWWIYHLKRAEVEWEQWWESKGKYFKI